MDARCCSILSPYSWGLAYRGTSFLLFFLPCGERAYSYLFKPEAQYYKPIVTAYIYEASGIHEVLNK